MNNVDKELFEYFGDLRYILNQILSGSASDTLLLFSQTCQQYIQYQQYSDINIKDKDNRSFLYYVNEAYSKEINQRQRNHSINANDEHSFFQIMEVYRDIARHLLEIGADPEQFPVSHEVVRLYRIENELSFKDLMTKKHFHVRTKEKILDEMVKVNNFTMPFSTIEPLLLECGIYNTINFIKCAFSSFNIGNYISKKIFYKDLFNTFNGCLDLPRTPQDNSYLLYSVITRQYGNIDVTINNLITDLDNNDIEKKLLSTSLHYKQKINDHIIEFISQNHFEPDMNFCTTLMATSLPVFYHDNIHCKQTVDAIVLYLVKNDIDWETLVPPNMSRFNFSDQNGLIEKLYYKHKLEYTLHPNNNNAVLKIKI